MSTPSSPTTVTIRPPSKYASASTSASTSTTFTPPPLDWLHRTWSVTHSTLPMWRTAQNVRITYSPLSPSPSGAARIDDLVEYESNKPGKAGVKSVAGVDTASPPSSSPTAESGGEWDWRGKGWLFFVGSHWEVLGWGERDVGGARERWVVTWFAKTVFSQEGVDFYCDRREGLSEESAGEIQMCLEGIGGGLAELVRGKVEKVDIKLPWQEK